MELVWLPSTTFHCNSCLPPQEGTLISSCVCFKMNQTVVEHVVYWLDSMISSTHSDKYNKWQAYSTCWPLCFSMGVSTVWHPAIVKHVCLSLFAWVVTNQWAQHWHCTLDMLCGIFPYFSRLKPNIWLAESNCKQSSWDSDWNWWRHCIWYAMHRWTGTQTPHIRIADKQGAVWYIILDLHCSCSCGRTSMYYVVAFSWSPVSAKGGYKEDGVGM